LTHAQKRWRHAGVNSFVSVLLQIIEQGNRRYQTSPALCIPITPFLADMPQRLRSEFSGFLFALA